jgi:hypothetical protein
VIVDVSVTTGQANEGKQLIEQIERIETTLGEHVECVTCDAGYAHGPNYGALEERGTDAVIPPQRISIRKHQRIPARRFKYDEHKDRLTCPNGKHLKRSGQKNSNNARHYRARMCDCSVCPLRKRCFSAAAKVRTILLSDGYTALLRARRRKERGWDEPTRETYKRHRWQVEGVHGRAKTQHGLARAIGRGMNNVSIQVYLTAAVMNLKKLANKQAITTEIDALFMPIRHLTTRLYESWTRWLQYETGIEKTRGCICPQLQVF